MLHTRPQPRGAAFCLKQTVRLSAITEPRLFKALTKTECWIHHLYICTCSPVNPHSCSMQFICLPTPPVHPFMLTCRQIQAPIQDIDAPMYPCITPKIDSDELTHSTTACNLQKTMQIKNPCSHASSRSTHHRHICSPPVPTRNKLIDSYRIRSFTHAS